MPRNGGRTPYGWTPESLPHKYTAADEEADTNPQNYVVVGNRKDVWAFLAIIAAIVLFVILTR